MIRAYIFRVARNRAIDFYRSKKKDKSVSMDSELCDTEASNDDETMRYHLCDKIDVDTIAVCIDSLDPIYADVLQYYYFYNHTLKEIAELFKIKETTARVRLHRGRSMLLKLLEGRILHDR